MRVTLEGSELLLRGVGAGMILSVGERLGHLRSL